MGAITLETIIRSSSSISDIALPKEVESDLNFIATKCYSQKGVYTVLVTLLYYKVLHPNQDVRLHQQKIKGGFSGRSFDTKYVTPELKRLGLPSMSESGWLTRSLEQPVPFTLDFPGRISGGVKAPFLRSLDFVENNKDVASNMLRYLLNKVKAQVARNSIEITPLDNPESITIDIIINALDKHFKYNYGTHNGAKLPVLAFYAIYQSIIKEFHRYKDCTLSPLASLTACDLTSKASGDVEIFKDGKHFEAVEIKLDKKIDATIVRVVEEKIYKFNPTRYYILSYYGICDDDMIEIQDIVDKVRIHHGCQIIINGLLPTIKYYLRLITNLEDFWQSYSSLVQDDHELQLKHKEVWNDIVKEINDR